ncbi:MAG: (2Fe-2S)-binding protein [Thermodesulfobacteriota bacterium]
MISLIVNDKTFEVDVAPDTPLLWVLRDQLQLTGTKYSCGIGECGSCTVHIDNEAVRSCQVPVQEASGKKITTIEGLPENHPVKAAWVAEEVPQCGYCQPGQIMQATAFLAKFPQPTDADIDKEMTGICRCGTYPRIRSAIHRAAKATPATAATPAPPPATPAAAPAATATTAATGGKQ